MSSLTTHNFFMCPSVLNHPKPRSAYQAKCEMPSSSSILLAVMVTRAHKRMGWTTKLKKRCPLFYLDKFPYLCNRLGGRPFHTHHHACYHNTPPQNTSMTSSPWRFASKNEVNNHGHLISRSYVVTFYHAIGLWIRHDEKLRGFNYCAFWLHSTSSDDPPIHRCIYLLH